MDTESEPYVRLATLRALHQVMADLNTARSLADTLQAVVDGIVDGLGYQLAAVNLVRPDGDLIVAAVAGDPGAEALLAGRVGSRTTWERWLSMAQRWGSLRFIPFEQGWMLDEDDVPQWRSEGPLPQFEDEWHPDDRLLAPMYAAPSGGRELVGVISVDRPRNGRRPGAWAREALSMYSFQAGIAISNARLRGNMQRALVRLEREQQALRASEESFRQAFDYAPSGMAVAEMGGDDAKLVRANDALCRLLGRPASVLCRYSFADLVHPDDRAALVRGSAPGGRAELRLARRDGSYLWVSLRNSVVADTSDGPKFLLTHVEDIEDRKRHELALAHRASHDQLTGLPNSAELRSRLGSRLCSQPLGADPGPEAVLVRPDGTLGDTDEFGYDFPAPAPAYDPHVHAVEPESQAGAGKGFAVLFCDLDGFKSINDRFGHHTGDAVLIEVARRLTSVVRDGDTVARLGGDEFVVLADGLDRDGAQELAVRLRNAIIPPIRVEGRAVRVGASFGIGWAGCGMTVEEILHSADQRMYDEKRRSKQHRRAG
ncbi:diguanylate cyclase CdgB [Streptomyces sp. SL13]|jgi:diguanylate cyclase (GGDEF)-like protein/PAS domain S-box-containing protein|uniref:Diguanylate cyclase CdgB n=1 Tax=Streptantibioticus silvisoli TaxID=2705255 RepID=A0AA90KFP4_9ACTN|nr:diguanylate cyclase CdgB [Streptantibioticus silvisoli]MDI5963715.1 diguanylate cyclase CdgB [Streptantibioticus silvisoli]MDI5969555.1 diguanylate cyclase CdgB [Streptantibioticus silvisoli]